MKSILLASLIVLLVLPNRLAAQNTVFLSGKDNYKSFRIPAAVRAPDGTIMAFAEGRVNGGGDFGNIDIVMRRSKDNGKNWSAIKVVASYDTLQAGNPAPVFDLTDPAHPKGRLFLFYNTGNNHEGENRKGKGLREVWYKTSTDAGLTWSAPVNITKQVHRPRQPLVNPGYNFQEDWRSYANAPGHAMQFTSGKFRGRIFIPANHSEGEPKPQFMDYRAHGFYSDDHGATFKLSDNINIEGSNESIAAEISGGRLMMNSRNQRGDIKARIVAISSDGGAKWDTVYFDKNLPDPVCQGSILTIGKTKTHFVLAFSNAANTRLRDNLTLRVSYDDGKTWDKKILVDQSSNGEKDYTAYSDLVQTGENTIGILYELNGYKSIVFKEIDWTK
ncbi:sialidase family protein [Dyadobacter aurulentus]|uniref:sialidase family protein n=1 Tax=Dyadobacter sp. UC 10 TaxID=2605428 RepID=UPI0011F2E5B1|nr:sialidase family protein [Dyadobacter sp. UC 10]KAA0990174.1 exo-alpha-sialidase [Dyadobacter sp. UC 10]